MFVLHKTAFSQKSRHGYDISALLRFRVSRYFIHRYLDKTKGFTLIELLIVGITIGVLSAIAMPNFIGQVGKAREAEAKNNLGILSRGQQAYHYERSEFYSGTELEIFVGFNPIGRYYRYTPNSSSEVDKAFHTAYITEPSSTGSRDFAAGVYFNSLSYRQIICIADAVDADGTSSSVEAQSDGSCNRGSSIK